LLKIGEKVTIWENEHMAPPVLVWARLEMRREHPGLAEEYPEL